MTGRPNDAKRRGSPLALRSRHSHCGLSRAMTRAKIVLAANFAQRLVPAAHSPRQAAREHHPRYAKSFSQRNRHLGCGGGPDRTLERRDWTAVPLASFRPAGADVESMTVTKLDLSGLKCPLPALKTRKALKSLAPGDRLEVRCTDPLAVIDIPHLVGAIGDGLEIIERGERETVFRIEKAPRKPVSKPPTC